MTPGQGPAGVGGTGAVGPDAPAGWAASLPGIGTPTLEGAGLDLSTAVGREHRLWRQTRNYGSASAVGCRRVTRV